MRIILRNFAVYKIESMKKSMFTCMLLPAALAVSCEVTYNEIKEFPQEEEVSVVRLDEIAEILSMVPLHTMQMEEVHDAVTSSSSNGYDEEYTMKNLFEAPGSGVGDNSETRSDKSYVKPLWKLIDEQVRSMSATKALSMDPDSFLKALTDSDVQIYWPFSEEWDGETMPVITFDPEDGASANMGYKLTVEDDGSRRVEEIVVDEEMARKVPVWVVNRNDDAGYTSLEMLRREDPEWGEGGGSIIVNPTKSSLRTLILKDFTMKRNYDSWFAGASEFFVKIGYMEDFTASTEAEMRIYSPMVTDFMIVVRRNQVGIPQNFNAILLSQMYDEVPDNGEEGSYCALMILEDDGGTQEDWTSKAKVFVAGKSYGAEVTIPLNVRDDIVWRGRLPYYWFGKCDGQSWPFGDVDLTFEIVEH